MPITISEKAAKELKNIINEQKLDKNSILRMSCLGGGCSGFTYNMDLIDKKNKDDYEFESNGITIVCDRKSYLFLEGTEIDFKNDLNGRGFEFKNENHNCCGCAKSFCPKN